MQWYYLTIARSVLYQWNGCFEKVMGCSAIGLRHGKKLFKLSILIQTGVFAEYWKYFKKQVYFQTICVHSWLVRQKINKLKFLSFI